VKGAGMAKGENGNALKAMSVLAAIMIGGGAAIIRPLQQQINSQVAHTEKLEEKIEVEINKAQKSMNLENDRTKSRLDKMEEWRVYTEQKLPPTLATLEIEVGYMKEQIQELRTKAENCKCQ
jgi:uncharacterized protein HemX